MKHLSHSIHNRLEICLDLLDNLIEGYLHQGVFLLHESVPSFNALYFRCEGIFENDNVIKRCPSVSECLDNGLLQQFNINLFTLQDYINVVEILEAAVRIAQRNNRFEFFCKHGFNGIAVNQRTLHIQQYRERHFFFRRNDYITKSNINRHGESRVPKQGSPSRRERKEKCLL